MHAKFEIRTPSHRLPALSSSKQVDRDNFYLARYGAGEKTHLLIRRSTSFNQIRELPESQTTVDLSYTVPQNKVRELPKNITCVGFATNYFGRNINKPEFWEILLDTIQALPKSVKWIDFGFIHLSQEQAIEMEKVIKQIPEHIKAYWLVLPMYEASCSIPESTKECYEMISRTSPFSNNNPTVEMDERVSVEEPETREKEPEIDEREARIVRHHMGFTFLLSNTPKGPKPKRKIDEILLNGEKEVETHEKEVEMGETNTKKAKLIAPIGSELGLEGCSPNGCPSSFFYNNQGKENETTIPTIPFSFS
ncbi:hypothetical protein Lnau_2554 [Legionella nautarum]|uniref:Uncharacterized protein n=1 Tax=Legionella nautarum TaxID=45070 RepID=A0A0W0WKQ7_9GAMM|nr:hypothetical protein Lnau_2554 [Legionella nautarum]